LLRLVLNFVNALLLPFCCPHALGERGHTDTGMPRVIARRLAVRRVPGLLAWPRVGRPAALESRFFPCRPALRVSGYVCFPLRVGVSSCAPRARPRIVCVARLRAEVRCIISSFTCETGRAASPPVRDMPAPSVCSSSSAARQAALHMRSQWTVGTRVCRCSSVHVRWDDLHNIRSHPISCAADRSLCEGPASHAVSLPLRSQSCVPCARGRLHAPCSAACRYHLVVPARARLACLAAYPRGAVAAVWSLAWWRPRVRVGGTSHTPVVTVVRPSPSDCRGNVAGGAPYAVRGGHAWPVTPSLP
jgi:hypothetical protein